MDKFEILKCYKEDHKYPVSLKGVKGIPSLIYYRGNIDILNEYKNVAVVGSRKASLEGLRMARETGRIVAENGLNVVNGLALGCDAEALKGALAVGGKCIAVMPCGLEQIQPKSHQKLAEEILEKGGCLISQYPVGTPIKEYQYVERDRIQSAISQGVLVVEAQEKSGTMHTVDFALKQYRRLACYYHALVKMASGNRMLEMEQKASVLKNTQDLKLFLADIKNEECYEQMFLKF